MKKKFLIAFILITCQAILSPKGYTQLPKNLGRPYQSAKRLVYIQKYEQAKEILEAIITNKKSNAEQVFYSQLLLTQIYSEGKELGKALALYHNISKENKLNMPVEHVCRYLDLLRRNGLISRAIEIAKRYHTIFSTQDRFVNIQSALNSYYQYYQNQQANRHLQITTVTTPDDFQNSYAYGIIAYGADFILLTNRYNFSQTQSFYTDAKMVLMANKQDTRNHTPTIFNQLGGFVQQGPATFFNNTKTVIFTANQYNKYNTGNRPYGSVNRLQLYLSTLNKKNKWTHPVNISNAFIKKASKYSFLAPSVDEGANVLYFASDMKGGFGGTDIYYCNYNKKRKKWGTPINMGEKVNTDGDESFPFIKNDTLLFSSNGLLGFGDQDIFMKKISDPHQPAIHLPYPINTQFKDISPVFDAKNNTLFFASDRNTHSTGFMLEQVYSIQSNLSQLLQKAPPQDLPIQKDTTIHTAVKDSPIEHIHDPSTHLLLEPKIKNIMHEEITHDKLTSTQNVIHFELNQSRIKKDQYPKLDGIYSNFINNPKQFIVAIDGHTDVTGTEKHNFSLSEMRAQSVIEYLIHKGIPKEAVQAQWFGFTRPIATCNKETDTEKKCQEINALNRRCEVYIKTTK